MSNRRKLNVYRWRKQHVLQYGNFGDDITLDILDRIFDIEPVTVPMTRAELIATGSILDIYHRQFWWRLQADRILHGITGSADLHIWGSGLLLPDSRLVWPQPVHVHAVRGRLTADRIGQPELPLGDPGILASRLVEKPSAPTAEISFVPHFRDYEWFMSNIATNFPKNWKVVRADAPVETVLTDIASSELVVSSSLHGLIVADSYGIPCVWATTERQLAGKSQFKYHDYASMRGLPFNEPLAYEDVARMTADGIHGLSTSATRPMAEWQDELIAAFPFR